MCDPPITKTTHCEDTEATISLQDTIANEGFSETLQEFTVSKKEQHEEYFTSMNTELSTVSSSSEKELTDIVGILKEEMRLLDTEMNECFSEGIQGIEQWNDVQKKVNKKSQRILALIEEFSFDLTDLEKTRSEIVKRVLGKYKKEAVKVMFLNEKNTEIMFEDIINSLNLSTLDNIKRFEDLKLKFRFDGEAIISKHHSALMCGANELAEERANELWGKVKMEQAKERSSATVNNMSRVCSKAKEDLYPIIDCLLKQLNDLAEDVKLPDLRATNEEVLEKITEMLNLSFETVNTQYSNVDEGLEGTIKDIEEGFDNERNVLSLYLQDVLGSEETDVFELNLTKLESLKSKELGILKLWQNALSDLANILNSTKQFSLETILFWRTDLKRQNEYQCNLEVRFDSNYQQCRKKEQELNSKLKIQIKSLREAPDKIKLESSSKALTEIFLDLSKVWSETFEFNGKTIEEFKNNQVPLTIKEIESEGLSILTKYPENLWHSQNNRSDSNVEENNFNTLLYQCFDYINLIKNTAMGNYEDLAEYIRVCEMEIRETYGSLTNNITKIVNDKKQQTFKELEDKILSFESITQMRLAELEIHAERLRSHQAGVNMIINSITTTYEDIKSDQKVKLMELDENLTNFFENHKTETRDQIKSAMSALEQEWTSLSVPLENRVFDAKMVCQHQLETLKHSNDSFIKISKSFKNGGNFSPNELTTLSKELKQIDKIVSNQGKTLSVQYNSLINDISRQKVDSILKILQEKLNIVLLDDKLYDLLYLTRMKLRSEIDEIVTKEKTLISEIELFKTSKKLDESLLAEIFALACSIFDDIVSTVPLELQGHTKEFSSLTQLPKKKSGANKTSSVVPKSLFENATDEDLKDGNNFLSRVKSIMCNKYLAMVQVIEGTLILKPVESTKPKNKEPKQTNENGLKIMEKVEMIKQALYSYNKECEFTWFELGKKFIRQITAFRMLIKDLSEHDLEEKHTNYVESLTSTEVKYKSMVLKILTEGTSEVGQIQKSVLLPLAHPSYQHKLDELYQLAKAASESTIKTLKGLFCDYQNDLQKKHDDYVENITGLRETLESIQYNFFDQTFCCACLFEKLKDFDTFLQNQTTVEKENNFNPSQLTELVEERIDKHIELSSVENEDIESPKYLKSIWSDDKDGYPAHITEFIDFEAVKENSIITMATSKLKNSVERLKMLYECAQDEYKQSEKELDNCMTNLKYDIKQAKLMYAKPLN